MQKKQYRTKTHVLGALALLLLPVTSVFASPPDSTSEKTSLLKGVSLRKVKSSLNLMQSTALSKLEEKEINEPSTLFSKFLSGLQMGGYYRAYGWERTMKNDYAGLGNRKVMTIGDGYYDPMLMMYVGGNPTANTSFGTELILANPFEAYTGPSENPRTFNTYYNMVLRGNTNTKYGNFGVVAGGIQWTQLSPFTFGSNVGYQRYSLWERRPWDPGGNVKERYASYYYNGTINQDLRFGTRAFKGFIFNGYNMPFNTSFDFFYGKTDVNGGFDRESFVKPKSNIGGRINKKFKDNSYVSLNTFNSYIRTDSINGTNNVQWNIYTTEFSFNFKEFNLNGEVGYGGYESPNYKRSWGIGALVNLITPKKYTVLPLSLRYFYLDKSFSSNVAQFSNTSIQEINSGFLSTGSFNLAPFGGNMSGVGDLNNNRQGVALNTEVKVWKLKFLGGIQTETEIDNTQNRNVVTYSHRINGLTWSRLPGIFPFQGGMGPNGRVKTFYRGAYETVNVSQINADSTALYKRSYNALDFQIKYKGKLFGKDLYIYNLNTVMSVQNKFSVLPVYSNKAYISASYHEGEIYYQLFRDVMFSVYGGLEYIKGNKYTDTTTALTGVNGVSGKARDQVGKAFGLGLDITVSNSTSLYLRQRWFGYDDRSFKDENFSGQEATVELKIFF